MKNLSLEIRVGLLILAALILLATFVFLLGGFQFGDKHTLYVDFDNPGNVKPGAPVYIGNLKVGQVDNIKYRGNRLDPETGKRALIRMRLELQKKVGKTVHEDAMFYVTSQSILGEQVIAIDPGSPELPVLEEGSVVQGVDPPRLDQALSLGYELLQNLVTIVREHKDDIETLLSTAADTLKALDELLAEHGDRIDRIIANVETATEEANALLASTRKRVESRQVQRILDNLDHSLASVSRDIDPILADVREATGDLNKTLDTFGPEQRKQIRTTLAKASRLTDRVDSTVSDAQEIVSHIREGRGTVGAIIMDEELYDDIQEMLRDLKHNPWKLFWRE